MNDQKNRIRVPPRFRKDRMPTARQTFLVFFLVFAVCFLAWALQWLGYWPNSWQSNGDIV